MIHHDFTHFAEAVQAEEEAPVTWDERHPRLSALVLWVAIFCGMAALWVVLP